MNKLVNSYKDKKIYLQAFFVPVCIMFVILLIKKVYPFGERMIIASDAYAQYVPFYREFYRKILSGGNLKYSWNIGLGSNFWVLYTYYLASPISWLIVLVSSKFVIEMMTLFIVIKIGLSGVTFSYYLSKRFNRKDYTVVMFSVFYSLSSYICAYYFNLMWLDGVCLFPIIVLGIDKIIEEKKSMLYCVTLGICIISNYYIALIICVFSVMYFMVSLYVNNIKEVKEIMKRFVSFSWSSLLAGGLGAFLYVPAYMALMEYNSGSLGFPKFIKFYFSIFRELSRTIMLIENTRTKGLEPNIYCTVLVFVLVPIYLINKEIDKRQKIGKVVFLVVLLLSFNCNILTYIWNGFHLPRGFPARHSYIYIFIVLLMCYEGYVCTKRFVKKQLVMIYVLTIIGLLVICNITLKNEENIIGSVYFSFVFVTLYVLVMYVLKNRVKRNNKTVITVLFVIAILESFFSMSAKGVLLMDRTGYVKDDYSVKKMLEFIEERENGFYRIEKINGVYDNESTWYGYKGVSMFSSTASNYIVELYEKIGLNSRVSAYSYCGNTPLTEALLTIKYIYGNEYNENKKNATNIYSETGENVELYLYENKYVLPFGFVTDIGFLKEIDWTTNDPFEIQNSIFCALGGKGKLFEPLEVDISSDVIKIEVDKKSHVYVCPRNSNKKVYIDFDNYGNTTLDESEMDSDEVIVQDYIHDMGDLESDLILKMVGAVCDMEEVEVYAYSFNEELFVEFFDTIDECGMELDEFEDTYIKGNIEIDEKGYAFISIPYEKGWEVLVDGKKVEVETFENAFFMIPIEKGKHVIELEYTVRGLRFGSMVSLICFVIIICIWKNQKKLVKTCKKQMIVIKLD